MASETPGKHSAHPVYHSYLRFRLRGKTMIVTDHFVYIHTSRTAGTFLNKLIMEHVAGARLIQYHGHLKNLPAKYAHLPVIGFVRNPWDWYISMFHDYRRKQQYVYKIVSDGCGTQAEDVIERFLNLGDGSVLSKSLLSQLVVAAPTEINLRTPPRLRNPGLLSSHFANYTKDMGYYSWLLKTMYETTDSRELNIGRFENLREETLRLFELTGTPITNAVRSYLREEKPANSSDRTKDFIGAYPPDLQRLVADKDSVVVEQFAYKFADNRWDEYPKTDFFRHLGSTPVSNLLERVQKVPESTWVSENEGKPNKLNNLNDAQHIMFRYVNGFEDVFNYRDYPIWEEWKDSLLPIMEQAAASLGYTDCRFPRVMLAKLPAGSNIFPHTDRKASHYIHKIHVPLITNPGTMFHVGDQTMHIPAGEMYEVNNKRNHAVDNNGEIDRIHLIFECYNAEDYGKTS